MPPTQEPSCVADAERPTKRRKAQLACNVCRDRKTRCDGGQPVCTPCRKRGFEQHCKYEESSLNTQRHVAALKQRIKDLERANAALVGDMSNASNAHEVNVAYPPEPSGDERHTVPQLSAQGQPVSSRDTAPIDGLATVEAHPLNSEADCSYGESSTIAFLRNLLTAVDRKSTKSAVEHPLVSHRKSAWEERPQGFMDVDPGDLLLPSRDMADDFLEAFWKIVHPLYTIFHRPSFVEIYRTLWEPPRPDSIVVSNLFWSTLNVVFALGCQFSSRIAPEKRASLAARFYERSRRLTADHSLDTASIEGVQLLLLSSVYLQSTSHASRCWNVLGLALRAAVGLGLHIEHKHRASRNQMEREVGRRVWFNCIILDRLQSMTFGRPTMLSRCYTVQPPEAIDDEFLQLVGNGAQSPHQDSTLCFLVHSIRLFDILSDVLSTVYDHSIERSPSRPRLTSAHLQEVLRLSSELDQFQESIPLHLRPQSTSEHPKLRAPQAKRMATFDLQANVLYCRFLYTRLLLLRPLLLYSCAGSDSSRGVSPSIDDGGHGHADFESSVVAKACKLCAETAEALITTIFDNMNSVLRNSVWYTVYFTFSAATVLIAARICNTHVQHGNACLPNASNPTGSSYIDHGTFQKAWTMVLAILDFHKDRIESAGRASQVLSIISAKLAIFDDSVAGDRCDQGRQMPHQIPFALPVNNHAFSVSRTENYNVMPVTPAQLPLYEDNTLTAETPFEEWTAEDFSSLDNAWFMQQISNLDFVEFDF